MVTLFGIISNESILGKLTFIGRLSRTFLILTFLHIVFLSSTSPKKSVFGSILTIG